MFRVSKINSWVTTISITLGMLSLLMLGMPKISALSTYGCGTYGADNYQTGNCTSTSSSGTSSTNEPAITPDASSSTVLNDSSNPTETTPQTTLFENAGKSPAPKSFLQQYKILIIGVPTVAFSGLMLFFILKLLLRPKPITWQDPNIT